MSDVLKFAIAAIVLSASFTGTSVISSKTAIAAHYTCTKLRFCGNFRNACLKAGGDYHSTGPTSPSDPPVLHCNVNEAQAGALKRFKVKERRKPSFSIQ